jgi:GR25 family glycosyltransferase involved in LPS biosynthesis
MSNTLLKNGFIIHLQKSTDRDTLVKDIQNHIDLPLSVYNASDGSIWLNDSSIPKKHPVMGEKITQGLLGCAYSHIDILKTCVKDNIDEVYLFEDDCEFLVDKSEITSFIHSVKDLKWDILLLGVTEFVESTPYKSIDLSLTQVKRFWGAHAMIFRKKAIHASITEFEDSLKKGVFLPADWIYNNAIVKNNLIALSPFDKFKFCKQSSGLISNITGGIRK